MIYISLKDGYENECRLLYISSFPVEERRDWQQLRSNLNKKEFDFYAVINDGDFFAILSVWEFEKFVYIEHFAVEEQCRNRGVGSKILQECKEKYKKPIVLEVEPPCNDIAAKRIDFYRRNSFELLSDKYIQPPYSSELPCVEMKIMTTDTALPFSLIKNTLYKCVYQIS